MGNDTEHLLCVYRPSVHLPWRNAYSNCRPVFNRVVVLLLLLIYVRCVTDSHPIIHKHCLILRTVFSPDSIL